MDETKPSLELRDIPDVTPLLPRAWWPWWVWLSIAAGIVLLILLIRFLCKQKTSATAQRLLAYQDAMKSLEIAKSLGDPVALSTALSLTLRRYLAVAFADPALFETHEELLARHAAFSALPDQMRHALAEFFSTLCRYKYAPCEEVVDLSLLVPQATSLLQQIHAVDPRPVAAVP
jgi:hypothetical protein